MMMMACDVCLIPMQTTQTREGAVKQMSSQVKQRREREEEKKSILIGIPFKAPSQSL